MAKRKVYCRIDSCSREANGSMGLCQACYMRMRRWEDRPLRQKLARVDQITTWQESLALQTGNVKSIKTRKRASR